MNAVYTAVSRRNYPLLKFIAEFPGTKPKQIQGEFGIDELDLMNRLKALKDQGLVAVDDGVPVTTPIGRLVLQFLGTLIKEIAIEYEKSFSEVG